MQTAEQNWERAAAPVSATEESSPEAPDDFYALGNKFKDQGNLDQAIRCYHKAIELHPNLAGAYNNLGNAYKFKRDLDKAVFYYQKACQIDPQYAQAYYNLGILYNENGRFQDARACYHKAVLFRPRFVEAHFNLGNTYRQLGKLDNAIQCYRKVLEINPDYPPAYNGLGTVYQEQGKLERALACYRRHLQIEKDAGIAVKSSLLLPVICDSVQSIVSYRKLISNNIENLGHQGLQLHDPARQIGKTNFYLAYHGLDNTHLQKKIARFYLDACPDLGWQAPHRQSGCRKHEKLKVGIISRYLKSHTIGYLNHGVIKYLNREKFHVTVFGFPGVRDKMSAAIAEAADQMIILPAHVSAARKIIAQQALDILLYLDIGMDPLTYFLAFSRLAPVQCTTWGHPDTTGIPGMDYYISSQKAEPQNAQDHYSECLILFDQFPMYCFRPPVRRQAISRSDLCLCNDHPIYACTQNLFKVHPDFDQLLAGILRRDPKGIAVFFEGAHSHWTSLLRRRLSRNLGEVMNRVRFLKRLPETEFLSFLRIPDVILDTPHFSGGYTSLLAFAQATPIVTWPGAFMRGRLTYGFYKQMGVMDAVADSVEAYIDIALRFTRDRSLCDAIRRKIKTHAPCLYDNPDSVRELERFFQWAIEQAQKTRND